MPRTPRRVAVRFEVTQPDRRRKPKPRPTESCSHPVGPSRLVRLEVKVRPDSRNSKLDDRARWSIIEPSTHLLLTNWCLRFRPGLTTNDSQVSLTTKSPSGVLGLNSQKQVGQEMPSRLPISLKPDVDALLCSALLICSRKQLAK